MAPRSQRDAAPRRRRRPAARNRQQTGGARAHGTADGETAEAETVNPSLDGGTSRHDKDFRLAAMAEEYWRCTQRDDRHNVPRTKRQGRAADQPAAGDVKTSSSRGARSREQVEAGRCRTSPASYGLAATSTRCGGLYNRRRQATAPVQLGIGVLLVQQGPLRRGRLDAPPPPGKLSKRADLEGRRHTPIAGAPAKSGRRTYTTVLHDPHGRCHG